MASYEQRDNSGILFKNDKREKDSHPHAQGTCMIDGVEYYISAWTKEGTKGKFQSLAFKLKEQKSSSKPVAKQSERSARTNLNEFDDENIPF